MRQDALDQQITGEDFSAFSARVKTRLETIPWLELMWWTELS